METNEKKENGTPFEFLDKIPDTECGIYVPAECESCGKKNSEICNTCPVLFPEMRKV
jgi:hypothetical protein